MGADDEGRRQFDELLTHDPDARYATHALFRSGEAAFLAGDRVRAKHQLEAFRQQYPDNELNAYALAHLGRIALDESKSADARLSVCHSDSTIRRRSAGRAMPAGIGRSRREIGAD